jgi:hypothetical protein
MIPVDIGNTPQVNHAVGGEGFPAGLPPSMLLPGMAR